LKYDIISTDDIRQEFTGDVSDLSKDEFVWNVAKMRTFNSLLNGRNVILDATNLNYYYRSIFIENLPECALKAKIFDINPDLAKERVKNDLRKGKCRSTVPSYVIDRMYTQFLKYCQNSTLRKEGFELLGSL
jgi:predicted kinase